MLDDLYSGANMLDDLYSEANMLDDLYSEANMLRGISKVLWPCHYFQLDSKSQEQLALLLIYCLIMWLASGRHL